MKSFSNNLYYNIEMKKNYKKKNNNINTPLKKQKTEKVINSNNIIKSGGIMSSNGWQHQNKYLFFKNHS